MSTFVPSSAGSSDTSSTTEPSFNSSSSSPDLGRPGGSMNRSEKRGSISIEKDLTSLHKRMEKLDGQMQALQELVVNGFRELEDRLTRPRFNEDEETGGDLSPRGLQSTTPDRGRRTMRQQRNSEEEFQVHSERLGRERREPARSTSPDRPHTEQQR